MLNSMSLLYQQYIAKRISGEAFQSEVQQLQMRLMGVSEQFEKSILEKYDVHNDT